MVRLAPVSSKKLIHILEKMGFEEIRRKGSHRFFYHSQTQITTVVPDHGAEDIGIGLLRKILRDIDITPQEFEQWK
ncbi:MAG: type II toxin-antitoxin system HicA family toxin [Candidatus Magasanikbacteria bacterium]|nr:type II toxin-antitoxin system HicA family toxin [Candidatus Magasanikbacteria bacterium]